MSAVSPLDDDEEDGYDPPPLPRQRLYPRRFHWQENPTPEQIAHLRAGIAEFRRMLEAKTVATHGGARPPPPTIAEFISRQQALPVMPQQRRATYHRRARKVLSDEIVRYIRSPQNDHKTHRALAKRVSWDLRLNRLADP